MENLKVSEFLAALPKDEVIYYRANPGNAGDALIAAGAFILFRQAGLNVKILDLKDFDASGKIVVYAGGGNLVGIYPEAREFFERFHETAKMLILLPHTVAGNEILLDKLGENVILFAREKVTHEHLIKHASGAKVYLDKDLAFNIQPSDFLNRKNIGLISVLVRKIFYRLQGKSESFSRLPQPALMLKNTWFELKFKLLRNTDVGNFFREDVERALKVVPDDNADLSVIYEYGTRNDAITDYTTSRLMKFISRFSKVRTDRLHVCIAAALMGKKVEFFPNSYFKCRAVYEFSLRDDYKNVKWKD